LFLISTNFALLKYPRFPFLLIAVLTNQSIYKIEQPNNLLSFGSMPTIVINEYFPNGAASYQNSQRTKEDNRSVGSQGEPKTTRNHQAELRDTTSSPKTLKYYIYRSFHSYVM
jgi:hypothetical protein